MPRRRQPSQLPRTARTLRCAIYTRKSSEEGLEQSFNSLNAQRDACEAFVASQKHEGWTVLPAAYDDGGFSGGSLQRPALQRLLDDVSKGSVDVVVVYKVDRLTRSLSDFAKLTDLFDRHGTSFVSVTQQFNTSTSMGRLTLNVLLSFAQFEREVAGERIRDKIAMSKRRGMWMGGLPPLGYDGTDGKLIVNEAEAETVRFIFRKYLELGSVADLKRSLDSDGIVSKRRTFADGRTVGGSALSRGALYQILRNRLYRGEIGHRGEVHRGKHEPIVDPDQWNRVQERLTQQSARPRGVGPSSLAGGGLLTGLAFDADGNRLTPTYASRRGRRYRYYVSAPLVRGGSEGGIRVPAADLERLVLGAIAERLRDSIWIVDAFRTTDVGATKRIVEAARVLATKIIAASHPIDDRHTSIRSFISRAVVSRREVCITLDRQNLAVALGIEEALATPVDHKEAPLEIAVAAQALRCGKQVRLVVGDVTTTSRTVDPALLRLIIDANRWFEDLRAGRAATIAEIAKRDSQQVSHVSRILPLAFLAPDIVEMVTSGRQPPTLTPERLKERRRPLPMVWEEQKTLLA